MLVCGLGISGLESALAINRIGIGVLCAEGQTAASYESRCKFPDLWAEVKQSGIEVLFNADADSISSVLNGCGLCILSPGIPFDSRFVEVIKTAGVPVTNELDLAVSLYGCPTVVVTGTNGKSTTVSLIHEILCAGGFQSILCGNVGRPVIADLGQEVLAAGFSSNYRERKTVLVVEASSYQIESSSALSPDVAVFLNLSENHLERHKTMERYFDVKCSLFEAQSESAVALFNCDDPLLAALQDRVVCRCAPFGVSASFNDYSGGVRINHQPQAGVDCIEVVRDGERMDVNINSTNLLGLHNRYNIAAAAYAALEIGASVAAVQERLSRFKPLEHRIEQVECSNQQLVYNDSKSTTPTSTCAALLAVSESFPDRRISVAIGGQMKRGGDVKKEWQQVCTSLKDLGARLDQLVCFGGDGAELQQLFSSAFDLHGSIAGNLEAAVTDLQLESSSRSVLLFSPGCASFDEFNGFEARGRAFKELIASS